MSGEFEPDVQAIAYAAAQVDTATAAVRAAEAALTAAEDALADAAGVVTVARAKAEHFATDESKSEWQRTAAQEDLSKRERAHARAESRVAAARRAVEDAREDLADAEEQLAHARQTPVRPAPEVPDGPPAPSPEVVLWVERLLGYVESPEREDSTWCRQWREHPEAVWRLSALYTAFVAALVDADLSSWWVNHFDRHAPMLFGRRGIFEACASNGHDADRPYRYGITAS